MRKRKKGKEVGRINWCRDECGCVGLFFFFPLCTLVLGTVVRKKKSFNDVHEFIKDLHHLTTRSAFWRFRIRKIILLIIIIIIFKQHHKLSQSSALLHLTPDWSCALRIAASRAVGGQHDPNILA